MLGWVGLGVIGLDWPCLVGSVGVGLVVIGLGWPGAGFVCRLRAA